MFRKQNLRHILLIAFLLLAGTLSVLVGRNFRSTESGEMEAAPSREADLSLKQIRYTETRGGERRWTLTADSAAHALSEGATQLENIRMVFHDPEGDLVMTARHGEMKTESREVEVQGDVVIRSPQGYSLFTEWLLYREAERQVRTDAPVRIVSKTMEVTGTGMRLDVTDRTFSLLSGVRARIEGGGS